MSLLPQPIQSCPDTLKVVHGGPDVEVEARDVRAAGVGLASVKVDHVADLGSTTVDIPVVAVKGGRVAGYERQS